MSGQRTSEYLRRTGSLIVSSGGTTGSPKTTFVSADQGIPRLIQSWNPLDRYDVLLNLFPPGMMWSAHYFYNELALSSGAAVLPMGRPLGGDTAEWARFFSSMSVTALAGTPSGILDLIQRDGSIFGAVPIRKIIWVGEHLLGTVKNGIEQGLGRELEWWGNYGSTETFVIGTNAPGCNTSTMHLLPDQTLTFAKDDAATLKRSGRGWSTEQTLFRLGDSLSESSCSCGRLGFTVSGRADNSVKIAGSLTSVSDVLRFLYSIDGVNRVQLRGYGGQGSSFDSVVVAYEGVAEASTVRSALLSAFYDLATICRQWPSTISAEVAGIILSDRTSKAPGVVRMTGIELGGLDA